MKVTLIYPPISVVERYGTDIGDIGGRQAPLGVLYLSSYLKRAGHDVQVIDAEAEQLDHESIVERIRTFQPDHIGVSITTVAYKNSVALAKKIREEMPHVSLIIGGPHITASPAEALQEDCFDVAIYGEGEVTFVELMSHFGDQLKYPLINGIVFRDSSNKIVVTEKREYIQDLDQLPYPDRDAVKIELYHPPIGCHQERFVVSLIASRGCPYRCIFCDNNTFGRKIRHFSSEYLVNEIEMVLKKYKAKELTFVDDTFPSKKTRFKRVLELILERNLKFSWTCMANVNDLNKEIIELMKKAGCWQIAIGIESGDDEVLGFIKKGITTQKVREVVNFAHEAGIMVKGFVMIGHPTETKESMQKTLNLVLGMPLTDVTCSISTPIKGTELYDIAMTQKYGKFDSLADTSKLSYWEPVFVPKGLTEDDLYKFQREFFKKFYLRPTILVRQLKKIRNFTILKRTLRSLYKIIKAAPKKGLSG